MTPRLMVASWMLLLAYLMPTSVPAAEAQFATPEAAFDAAKKATRVRDWETVRECLSPAAAAAWTTQLVREGRAVTFRVGPSANARKLTALLARHDASPETFADQPELRRVLDRLAPEVIPPALLDGTLADVAVTGDEAAGQLRRMVNRQEVVTPLGFVRLDGGWRLTSLGDGPAG